MTTQVCYDEIEIIKRKVVQLGELVRLAVDSGARPSSLSYAFAEITEDLAKIQRRTFEAD